MPLNDRPPTAHAAVFTSNSLPRPVPSTDVCAGTRQTRGFPIVQRDVDPVCEPPVKSTMRSIETGVPCSC